LGQTKDDAVGEAFDKVAKVLGLPYPGGPSIAKVAAEGSTSKYKLPRPRMSGYDFSYSGLKTAVLRLSQAEIGERYDFPSIHISDRLTKAQTQDIAAVFQYNAVAMIVDKVKQACQEFSPKSILVAGGVGANLELRRQLSEISGVEIQFPDITLCTDNGAMVGSLGYYMSKTGQETADPYELRIEPNLSM
jgi:N6-L-threonylcarbamoyladenine synthase